MQTKLNKEQKQTLKAMREDFFANKADAGLVQIDRVTVAAYRDFVGADTVKVSVAVASSSEEKISRKVGEYLALARMEAGQYVVIPAESWDTAELVAERFAESIAYL